jgi:hypothetical protein
MLDRIDMPLAVLDAAGLSESSEFCGKPDVFELGDVELVRDWSASNEARSNAVRARRSVLIDHFIRVGAVYSVAPQVVDSVALSASMISTSRAADSSRIFIARSCLGDKLLSCNVDNIWTPMTIDNASLEAWWVRSSTFAIVMSCMFAAVRT